MNVCECVYIYITTLADGSSDTSSGSLEYTIILGKLEDLHYTGTCSTCRMHTLSCCHIQQYVMYTA